MKSLSRASGTFKYPAELMRLAWPPLGQPLRFFSGMVMAAYCAAHLVRMSWARRLIDIGALTVISGINGFTYSGGIHQFELAAQFNLATSSSQPYEHR